MAILCRINTDIKTGATKSYGNEAAEKSICDEWLNVSRDVATLETSSYRSVIVNSNQYLYKYLSKLWILPDLRNSYVPEDPVV